MLGIKPRTLGTLGKHYVSEAVSLSWSLYSVELCPTNFSSKRGEGEGKGWGRESKGSWEGKRREKTKRNFPLLSLQVQKLNSKLRMKVRWPISRFLFLLAIRRCWFISERQCHLNYLTNSFWPKPPHSFETRSVFSGFRVTQLRAVPFKTIKCGFSFSEVILFNPSGLKQPIKESLTAVVSPVLGGRKGSTF